MKALILIVVGTVGCRGYQDMVPKKAPRAECEQPDACLDLGRAIVRASSVPDRRQEHARFEGAVLAYERACEGGIVAGCVEGLAVFESYKHGELPRGTFIRLAEGACDLGDVASCVLTVSWRPISPDQKRMLARRVCEVAPQRCSAAISLVWSHDRRLAFDLARHQCEQRLAAPCSQVAKLGFEDMERELLLTASCELDNGVACYELGKIEAADPVRTDGAVVTFRRACKLGNSDACAWVGKRRADP